jgi:hypothetical protein
MSAEDIRSLAIITCVEFGREPRSGETWQLRFADIGEVAIYCPECAEREFSAE